MLREYKVVHFSQTPLVGAPGKISKALNNINISSSSYCYVDYPNKGGLYGKFIDNTHVINNMQPHVYSAFIEDIKRADIIHIHNGIDLNFLKKIISHCPNAIFIYQVHSPLREGPLFIDRSDNIGVSFSKKLVVAQYQPRHYQDYTLVPNLVLDTPSLILREGSKPLKVLFSPAHKRPGGRWNTKTTEGLEDFLISLDRGGVIELIKQKEHLHPSSLMLLRRHVDITIDEIATGAFHQVSLEGLCAGNVVINRADFFSKSMLACVSGSPSLPPFVNADSQSIFDVLIRLSKDIDETNKIKEESYFYFMKYLNSNKMVKNFMKVYDEVI